MRGQCTYTTGAIARKQTSMSQLELFGVCVTCGLRCQAVSAAIWKTWSLQPAPALTLYSILLRKK